MKYLKNALTAILLLTSFSAHCSSNDDENSLTKDAFVRKIPYSLSNNDQASLNQLANVYQGNLGDLFKAADSLFFRSRVCSERNIVSYLTILAEQNDPLSFASSYIPFLRNYDNADCCDFIMNTVKKHDNADDTPKSFSEFCLDLVGKSISIGGEFDQDSLVEKLADLLSLSKQDTKLAIGYSDLEKAQSAADDAKSAADDAKRVADDAKRVADDAKRVADDAKRVADDANRWAADAQPAADEAKRVADAAKLDAAKARRDANITSSDLEQMEIAAEKARCAADKAKRDANIVVSDSESDSEEAEENIVKQAMRAVKKAKSAASNLERKADDAETAETDAEVNSVKKAMRAAKEAKSAASNLERKTFIAESRAKTAKRKADDAESAEVAAGFVKRKADDAKHDADDAKRNADEARRIAEAKKQDIKLKINSLLVMDFADKIRPSDRNKVLNFIDKSITDMRSGADDKPVSFFELLASSVEK